MSCLLDPEKVVDALSVIEAKYRWEKQPSVIVEVIKALLHPDPHDRETEGFETLHLLEPRFRTWEEVAEKCQDIGRRLSIRMFGGKHGAT